MRLRHVMAILNITPDSFYSDSRHSDHAAVCRSVERAMNDGATIIDLGGYSSRPGADEVSVDEEWRRVEMGLQAVSDAEVGVVVSVDTFRAEIVRRAYEAYGPFIVNDISAGEADKDIIGVVAELGLPYVAMHMRGTPETMQSLTEYEEGVTKGVVEYFRERVEVLVAAGIAPQNIILDPGFGFAKTLDHNYELMAHLQAFKVLQAPLLVGVSRKSMVYRLLDTTPEESLNGTTVLNTIALMNGASILRVHDVKEAVEAVKIYRQCLISE